jgi:hypothetical protein
VPEGQGRTCLVGAQSPQSSERSTECHRGDSPGVHTPEGSAWSHLLD